MSRKLLYGLTGLGLIASTFVVSPASAETSVSPAVGSQSVQQPTAGSTSVVLGTTDGGAKVFDTEQAELTIRPAAGPEPSNAELGTMAAIITCELNVQNVHPSSHVNGTINGVATLICSQNASLTLHYSLIRVSPDPTQWGGPSNSDFDARSIQSNRAVNCSEGPGTFRGWAQGEMTPPPGYQLADDGVVAKYGNIEPVACGGISRTSSGGSGVAQGETVSVTFVRSDLTS